MCGRFTLTSSGEELARSFALDDVPSLAPRYNIAPTQPVAVVRAAGGGRLLDSMRWGLVPSWARAPSIGSRLINARAETAAEKPAFRAALRARRCIVPADGFYEWVAGAGRRRPFLIRVGEGPFGIAGLWETWRSPDGEALLSCTLLTTEANERVRPYHDRMPVVLSPRDHARWIDPDLRDPAALAPLLAPCPPGWISAVEVGPRVNDVRHDDPACLEPVAPG